MCNLFSVKYFLLLNMQRQLRKPICKVDLAKNCKHCFYCAFKAFPFFEHLTTTIQQEWLNQWRALGGGVICLPDQWQRRGVFGKPVLKKKNILFPFYLMVQKWHTLPLWSTTSLHNYAWYCTITSDLTVTDIFFDNWTSVTSA